MRVFLAFTAFFFAATSVVGQVTTFQRGSSFEIELLGAPLNPSWGPLNRDADHATVAMNDQGDIVVAYHSSRNPTVPGGLYLKQAEIAYFQFVPDPGGVPANDSWTLLHQELIGSINHDPLFTGQVDVKCERPDVIAVGDKFFVSWTRRYDRDFQPPSQIDEPARLECAWVERIGASVAVYGALGGQGHPLDQNYLIRECTGVADAVVLKQPAGGNPTVGIAYPRQTDFGDYTGDNTRLFEMAFVTCTLNGQTVTSSTPVPLRTQIPMDGPSAPGGATAGGLVLPDLAPSDEENAFWLAYEGQTVAAPNVLGQIRLEYWKFDAAANGWQLQVSKLFHTTHPMTTVARRRPMVSALPGTGNTEEVSIAFNRSTGSAGSSDLDVVYSQWGYQNGGILPLAIPNGHSFVNNMNNSDHKPVSLHGPGITSSPYLRRVYFDRTNTSGHSLLYYDTDTNAEVTIPTGTDAFRAAVSYAKPVGYTDSIALTYEALLYPPSAPAYKRIVLRVD